MIDIPFSPWERFRTNVCSSFFFLQAINILTTKEAMMTSMIPQDFVCSSSKFDQC